MVERVHVELPEADFLIFTGSLVREDGLGVLEYVVEEVVLDVLAGEGLGVVALDGEGLAAEIADATNGDGGERALRNVLVVVGGSRGDGLETAAEARRLYVDDLCHGGGQAGWAAGADGMCG